MPITAENVTEPAGHIAQALFPADSPTAFEARLTAYVTEAYARAAVVAIAEGPARDAAAAAWVYARAFRAAYVERSAEASRTTVEGQGSSATDMRQIANLEREASEWRIEYDRLTEDVSAEELPRRSRSGAAPVRFRF